MTVIEQRARERLRDAFFGRQHINTRLVWDALWEYKLYYGREAAMTLAGTMITGGTWGDPDARWKLTEAG